MMHQTWIEIDEDDQLHYINLDLVTDVYIDKKAITILSRGEEPVEISVNDKSFDKVKKLMKDLT